MKPRSAPPAKSASKPVSRGSSLRSGARQPRAFAPQETELKLHLPEQVLEALVQRPSLVGAIAKRQRLDNLYLDTADRLLQQKAMALRLRRDGRRWVQTLKTAGHPSGGLAVRGEWESPAAMRRGRPSIDRAALQTTPLPELLRSHHDARLMPVFRTIFTREARTITDGSSVIEVAIDRGRIETVGAGKPRSEPISEVELELKRGRAEDLVALAVRLIGRGADALPLVPLSLSKAERGYRLTTGKDPGPVKAAARGFVDKLADRQSSGAALRAIVRHGLSVLLENTAAMREGSDDEYVHQARVALRRVRSGMRLLDRENDDFPPALAKELQWAGRLLGNARDWDVLVGETLPAVARGLDAAQREALLRAADVKRGAARQSTFDALKAPRFARLALRLQAWAMTPPPRGSTLAKLAAPALRKARRRILKSARFFVALTPENRHRVRILAKRLRYSLDVFSVTLPKEATERYTDALSELQDVLGELNDLDVARTSLDSLAGSEMTSRLSETIERREHELLFEAEKRLLALAEQKVPWD